ncbi:MAG: hypothetical protein ACYCO0_00975 [Candidatus Micrarchaeaceae archaeon]
MPDEVTFIDLSCLLRITPDTTLEKLGSAINASIFDASNIAGSLKQKGLIDFSAYYPGPNTISVTDAGKALIAESDAKAAEPFDDLDDAILTQLSGGKRVPIDLQNTLGVRPKDLALRIYKLEKQGFLTYELKSGTAEILLTASGFIKSKSSSIHGPQKPTALAQSESQAPPQTPDPLQEQSQELPKPSTAKNNNALYLILIIIAIALLASYYLKII